MNPANFQHFKSSSLTSQLGNHNDNSKRERVLITHICAVNVVSGVRCTLAAFYVSVEINGMITKTSCQPMLAGNGVVEWDDVILLPPEQRFIIFKVYGRLRRGEMGGNGVLLCRFRTTVRDLLDFNSQLQPVTFLDKGLLTSQLSLRVIVERRVRDIDGPATRPVLSMPGVVSQVALLTANGHRTLLCYRQCHLQKDLDDAVAYFECAREICPPDHPIQSSVLFNLATVRFVHCRDNGNYTALGVPIALYRDALQLRTSRHGDHRVTALDLCLGLLAHLEIQRDKTEKKRVPNLLSGAVVGYAYQLAWLALQMAGVTVPIPSMRFGTSHKDSGEPDDEELIRWIRSELARLPDGHSSHSALLATLGMLLSRRFVVKGDLDDINEAILLLEKVVQLTPDIRSGKVDLMNFLASSLSARFGRLGDLADINRSILVFERALRCLRDNDPTKPAALASFGTSLCRRFEHAGDLADIDKSISMFDFSLRLTPNGHPDRPGTLTSLGISLCYRFERLGHLTDINKCISMQEEATSLTLDGHVDKPSRLSNLGVSYFRRFQRLGDLADVNKSIVMQEAAMRLAPNDHSNKASWLSNLASSLSRRFQRLGDLADVNRSVLALEEALHLMPDGHPNRPVLFNNLGLALSDRFDRFGNIADLNQSILMYESSVRLTPDGHPDKPARLIGLGDTLSSRFQRLGDIADIHQAISMQEDAVHLTPNDHPDRPGFLSLLAGSLSSRFERLGDLADLNKSISLEEEAIHLTPSGHPQEPTWLSGLGQLLSLRFERLGNLADINKSISMHEKAMNLVPNDHPSKPSQLSSVGCSLSNRFERLGDLTDINKSILMLEEALQLTSNDDPSKATRLNSLGTALHLRFEHLGDLVDTNRSIVVIEEAVRLTPDDHPYKPTWLSNLGNSLFCRFDRLNDPVDIDQSISITSEAVHLTPNDHPDKPICLNNLGNLFLRRFDLLTDLADLDKSISLKEEAVRLSPDDDPGKAARLNNLGLSFFRRFERLGHFADIDQSISVQEEALRLTPNDHPDKLAWLNNLGNAYMLHFRHSSDPSSLSTAISHFSSSARSSTGATHKCFYAARGWISCARLQSNPGALLDAYISAIRILPELAWLGFPLAERHRLLSEAAHIARDAAATAIEAGYPEMAVEWLEQGRSVVWNQFLQLRTPVDELHIEYPDLALRFQEISRELEHVGSSRENAPLHGLAYESPSDAASLEKRVQKHHELALTRDKFLVEIRSLPGFDRFLLPKTVKQLASSLHSGPVVYLNASRHGCDALIVTAKSANAIPVPLLGVSYRELEALQSMLRLVLEQNRLVVSRHDISALFSPDENSAPSQLLDVLFGDGTDPPVDRAVRVKPLRTGEYTSDELFQEILEYLWSNVVKPVLDALAGCSAPRYISGRMSRIFWCPTGPFAFLPIHAAGIYSTGTANPKLPDFAISSYIPTLGSLASSVHNEPNSSSSIHLVAVPQPPTDGLDGLVSVKAEIDLIRELSAKSPSVTVQDSHGTVEDVMEKMKNADWVHFACHGIQDPHDPLNSGLCLANHRRLKLSDIIRLSRPQGGLAFLSACQTAQGDEKLAEESVHLAAGMLLAGYGGVIATMWAIRDRDAPRVAKDVYERLFRDGKVPDSTEAAEALHYAVQRLRESGASFASWVPFIHVGR